MAQTLIKFQPETWSLLKWQIIFSLLIGIIYLPYLGYLPLHLEEPRRALIAANMLHSGDYLIPIHAGHIYLGKPPLFNWLIAICSFPFNAVTTWSARLPSVISLWLLTLFLVSTAWKIFGTRIAIFWGCALILGPEIMLKGRIAETDIVFMSLVTTSLWSWWLRDQANKRGLNLWMIPLIFMTLAYLTKREPAIVFFYLTIGLYLLWHKRGYELFNIIHLSALFIVTIPILIWLLLIANNVGWNKLWNSMLHEVLLRGNEISWKRYLIHVTTYPLQIFAATAPFSLLLLPLINTKLRHSIWKHHNTVLQFISIGILVNLPIYWFKGSIAIRYFLPMFPFILLITALSYDVLLSSKFIKYRWQRVLLPVMIILMLLLRSIEWFIYLPIKFKYLVDTQNSTAIIKDIMSRLPVNRPLFVSERIPSAIWLHAPFNSMQLLQQNSKLAIDDLILRHNAMSIKNVSYVTVATYQYENDILYLEQMNSLNELIN
jgi:4-amino-4-deoxy-L-arabinose transferase-like glycosyltransferase